MSILKITTHPNANLRKTAKPVDTATILTKDFQKLLADMAETMLIKDGIGLAAPQVGIGQRIIVVNTKHGILAMVNPVLSKLSIGKEWDEEGCLSVPHTFGKVKRHKSVHCEFWNKEAQVQKIEAHGLFARVLQHEIDHLDGILFIDKAKDIIDNTYNL
jgi:peptide deformylase